MTLIAFGINHNTAPVDVREAVAFAPDQMLQALQNARESATVREVAILSTCNRTEIYADMEEESAEPLLHWLARYHATDGDRLRPCHYVYSGTEAARHMMRVASGLDSLVLGEPQILGQMKSAYALANDAGSLGTNLHAAFHKVFSVAKRVRSETAIGENPVSVAYAAVSLAQQIFSDLKQDTALLIGAGETIELVARHLVEHGLKHIIVANRTLANAVELARKFGGEAILLADMPAELHRADIVISSTASQLPLLGKGAVEAALKRRRHKPMFMVDIAVPRDIEAQVGELSDVYLYTVDDLRDVIDENMRSREEAAKIAAEIINEGVISYADDLRSLDAVSTIRAFRHAVEDLRDVELAKTLRQLRAGGDVEEAMRQLARNLANKFMHKPTQQIKRASVAGDHTLVNSLHRLFELELAVDATPDPSEQKPNNPSDNADNSSAGSDSDQSENS
jgi:glutamyl-tRNA reductase